MKTGIIIPLIAFAICAGAPESEAARERKKNRKAPKEENGDRPEGRSFKGSMERTGPARGIEHGRSHEGTSERGMGRPDRMEAGPPRGGMGGPPWGREFKNAPGGPQRGGGHSFGPPWAHRGMGASGSNFGPPWARRSQGRDGMQNRGMRGRFEGRRGPQPQFRGGPPTEGRGGFGRPQGPPWARGGDLHGPEFGPGRGRPEFGRGRPERGPEPRSRDQGGKHSQGKRHRR